jgi:peptidoglycan/LPS O-acetylase OafA/YrhL
MAILSAPPKPRYAPQLPERIPSLDGLRAISILLVVAAHSIMGGHPGLYLVFGHLGNVGVRVFFVISGFLITTLLLKEYDSAGQVSLKNFYARRTLRILPAFCVYVAVVWVLAARGLVQLLPGDMLHTLTYTMNYHVVRSWYVNHLWSLSVEEQFYLLWPAMVLLLGAARGLRAAGAALLIAPVCRIVMYFFFDANGTILARHFQAVCDALATGCVLAGGYNWLSARAWHRHWVQSPVSLAAALALIGVSLASFKVNAALYYLPGQSVANFGIAILLDRCVRNPEDWLGRVLHWAPMRFIGVISYSIYLWQELFLDYEPTGLGIPFTLNVVCTAAASVASYYMVERQFLKLKGRFGAAHRRVVKRQTTAAQV